MGNSIRRLSEPSLANQGAALSRSLLTRRLRAAVPQGGTEYVSAADCTGPSFPYSETGETRELKRELLEERRVCILSLDGGGVRGIIPAVILSKLETELQAEAGRWQKEIGDGVGRRHDAWMEKGVTEKVAIDTSKLRIIDFFDVVGGTSTGGLIAAFLTTKKEGQIRPAARLPGLYEALSADVFPSSTCKARGKWPDWYDLISKPLFYNTTLLEDILKQELGADVPMSNTVKPCIMPSFCYTTQKPYIWETGPRIGNDEFGYTDVPLWRVCRATSAAPTFLKAAEITRTHYPQGRPAPSFPQPPELYYDGGLYANDPVLFAYRWPFANTGVLPTRGITGWQAKPDHVLILSLGCGLANRNLRDSEQNPVSLEDLNTVRWAKPLIKASMDGSSQSQHFGLFYPFLKASKMPAYLRLQPRIERELEPLDRSESIGDLKMTALHYLHLEQSHQDSFLSIDPHGRTLDTTPTELVNYLAASYGHQRVAQLLKETNGQTLARFAELLVWEWYMRLAENPSGHRTVNNAIRVIQEH